MRPIAQVELPKQEIRKITIDQKQIDRDGFLFEVRGFSAVLSTGGEGTTEIKHSLDPRDRIITSVYTPAVVFTRDNGDTVIAGIEF